MRASGFVLEVAECTNALVIRRNMMSPQLGCLVVAGAVVVFVGTLLVLNGRSALPNAGPYGGVQDLLRILGIKDR